MMTDMSSSDVRRCTVVKIQASDSPSESPPPLPKARELSIRPEPLANRWTTGGTHPSFEGSLLDGMTPKSTPSSTLSKPKRLNSFKESDGEKALKSLSYVDSDNIFGDKPKRNDTFSKKFRDFKEKDFKESDAFSECRNTRGIFISQIQLIFHISLTICLIGYKGYETNLNPLLSNRMLIIAYFGYLLVVSIALIIILRFRYVYSDDIGLKEIRSEQLAILLGAASLGTINLIHLTLEIVECIDTELVFIPVLHFVFTLLLIHHLLTQVIPDQNLGLRNAVISQLLSTQISLWIISFESKPDNCQFTPHNNWSSESVETENREALLPSSVSNLMIPIIHHYKLLTIFILITVWFTSNQSKISFIRSKLFDEEAIKTAFLSGKSSSLKGFLIGFTTFLLAIVVILLDDNQFFRLTHIFIQSISALILIIGLLIIRRKKKYLNYKYKMNFLDYHFVLYLTLLAAFVFGLKQVVITSDPSESRLEDIVDGLSLLLQISLQSFLLRLERRKFVRMNQIFIVSVFFNLSLWALEVYQISVSISMNTPITDFTTILYLFVSLNRFYSALVFYQFWKFN